MKKIISLSVILTIAAVARMQAQNESKPVRNSPESGTKVDKKKHPNVIFFLVDDMGWSDVGYQGSSFYETPNIDKLAKEGVRFNQAYAACSVCSPTRASILTGQYPARLHLTDWLQGRQDHPFQKLKSYDLTIQHLPYDQATLPKVLKENGYHTALFGKWHLGEDSASTQRQGFDLHVPNWNRGWPNKGYFSPFGMDGLEDRSNGEYLTDRLTEEAVKWLEKNRDHPFFLYLSHFGVHDPIEGRGDLVAKYKSKLKRMPPSKGFPYILEGNPDDLNPLSREALNNSLQDKAYQGFSLLPNRTVKIRQHQDNPEFAAMVESVDESLGRVVSKIKELGLDDNTIIIFFSDNGGMSSANLNNFRTSIAKCDLNENYSTSNLPLRGGKGWLYEGGIREPLIMYWPQKGNHGTVSNVPVISTDFYPTILDMLGLSAKARGDNGIDGRSLVPLLQGNNAGADSLKQQPLYWHFPHYSNHGAQSPCGAIRLGDDKLIEYYENNTVQLFDLKSDPGEQNDLSRSQPQKVKKLRNMLDAWRKKVNAIMPPANPKFDPKETWPTPASIF